MEYFNNINMKNEHIKLEHPSKNRLEALRDQYQPDVADAVLKRTDANKINLSNNAKFYNRKANLRADQVGEYFVNKYPANVDLLIKKEPNLAKIYQEMLTRSDAGGRLSCVRIVDDDIESSAHFITHGHEKNDDYAPEVHFNLSNIETYTEPALDFVLKRIAIEVGAQEEDVMNNKKLVSAFIFLHEFGHADDFLNNDLWPLVKAGKTSATPPPRHQLVNQAIGDNQKARLRDLMTLPIPGNIEPDEENSENQRKEFHRFKPRLKAMGINNKQEYKFAEKRAYREMRSEKYADDFATKFIMDHYSDYFLTPGEKDDGSGRIKTGELVEMDENFGELLGMKEGNYLSLEKIWPMDKTARVSYGHKQEGFLVHNVAIGKNIELGDGNADHSYKLSTTEVKKVKRRVKRSESGSFQQEIFVETENRSVYKALVDSGKNTPVVEYADATELNRTLNLSVGSEVQLLKYKIASSSAVQEGYFSQGRLERPIAIGHGVKIDNSQNNYLRTTRVQKIGRRWKTWLIKTDTSIYEVLPVPEVEAESAN